jgi:hypothetical protein
VWERSKAPLVEPLRLKGGPIARERKPLVRTPQAARLSCASVGMQQSDHHLRLAQTHVLA